MVWIIVGAGIGAALVIATRARRDAREALVRAKATSAASDAALTAQAADATITQAAIAHGIEDVRARLRRLEEERVSKP